MKIEGVVTALISEYLFKPGSGSGLSVLLGPVVTNDPPCIVLLRYSSCCWRSLINGGDDWNLRAVIDLTKPGTVNGINASPIPRVHPPLLFIQPGCATEISTALSSKTAFYRQSIVVRGHYLTITVLYS